MKIFRVIGIGLVILILQALMSDVFNSFEHMLISLFGALNATFDSVGTHANVIHLGM